MSDVKILNDVHAREFTLEVKEVADIVSRNVKMDAEELQKRGASAVYPIDRADFTLPEKGVEAVPIPVSIAEALFPPVLPAPRHFCYCARIRWCLTVDEFGRIRYVLKCIYWCFPFFSLD